MSPLTVIGLGSNLGDGSATIERAMQAIEALPGVEMLARSSLWRTAPVGATSPQPDYCNAAVAVRSSLPPADLMERLLAIEARFGRQRGERNAARTLDLDLLWIEGVQLDSPDLVIPHPRLHERPFAMVPLLEVVGDAADPKSGKLYALTLAEIGAEGVEPYRWPDSV